MSKESMAVQCMDRLYEAYVIKGACEHQVMKVVFDICHDYIAASRLEPTDTKELLWAKVWESNRMALNMLEKLEKMDKQS